MMNQEIKNQLKLIILQNIKRIRAINGISEDYMSIRLGISQGQYSKIESGRTKNFYKSLDIIAAILEVSVLELAIPITENKKASKDLLAEINNNQSANHKDNKNFKNIEWYKDYILSKDEKHLNELVTLKLELSAEQNQLITAELRIKELETKLEIILKNKQGGGGG